jgi:hypothetical protein
MTISAKKSASLRAYLAKLVDSWGQTSRKIEQKKAQLSVFGAPEGIKPSLFGKFRKLLDQIALFANKERDIISEINAVEQKHRALRKRKLLKRAEPEHNWMQGKKDYEKEAERRRRWFWWIIIFWILMTANRQNRKISKNVLRAG